MPHLVRHLKPWFPCAFHETQHSFYTSLLYFTVDYTEHLRWDFANSIHCSEIKICVSVSSHSNKRQTTLSNTVWLGTKTKQVSISNLFDGHTSFCPFGSQSVNILKLFYISHPRSHKLKAVDTIGNYSNNYHHKTFLDYE